MSARGSGLEGTTVVITRAAGQVEEFAGKLRRLGAECMAIPTIEIVPTEEDEACRRLWENAGNYHWIVLTSVNGVRFFFDGLRRLHGTTDCGPARVAAVGPATADALMEYGVQAACVPSLYTAEELADALGDVAGRTVLLPRTDIARKELPALLKEKGAVVDELPVYNTRLRIPEQREIAELVERRPDYLTFASASAVRGLLCAMRGQMLHPRTTIACIGPVTAAAVQNYGYRADIVADVYSIDGLIDALLREERFRPV